MKNYSRWLGLIMVISWFGLAGCGSKPPLDRVIKAENAADFAQWRARLEDDLTPAQRTDLEQAMQELKYKAGNAQKGLNGPALNEAVCQMLHGHSVRDAMRMGFEWRLARYNDDRAEVEEAIAHDSRLRTREGDTDSSEVLKQTRENQNTRHQKVLQQIKDTEEKLNSLKADPAKS